MSTITKIATDTSKADANKARVAAMSAPATVKETPQERMARLHAANDARVKAQVAQLAQETKERAASAQRTSKKASDTMSANAITSNAPATSATRTRKPKPATLAVAELLAATPASATPAKVTRTRKPASVATPATPAKVARTSKSNATATPASTSAPKKATASEIRAAQARRLATPKPAKVARTPRATLGAKTLGGTRIGGATPREGTCGYRLLNAPALNTKKAITRDAWLASAGVAEHEPYRQAIAHLRYGLRVLRTYASDGKTEMYTRIADALAYGSDATNVQLAIARRVPVAKPAKPAKPAQVAASKPATRTSKSAPPAKSAPKSAPKPATRRATPAPKPVPAKPATRRTRATAK